MVDRIGWCRECHRKSTLRHYWKNADFYRRQSRAWAKKTRARNRALVEQLKDQPCAICGAKHLLKETTFRYLKPRGKGPRPRFPFQKRDAADEIRAEAAKCEVVGRGCLRQWKLHREEISMGKWRRDGKCNRCGVNPKGVTPSGRRRSWCVDCTQKWAKENMRKRSKTDRAFVDNLKDKLCADCGVKYPPWVMDFDHREGEKKVCAISTLRGRSGSVKRIMSEVAKCDLVCANCHRQRTHARMVGAKK